MHKTSWVVLVVAALALAACGGGGEAPPSTPEGPVGPPPTPTYPAVTIEEGNTLFQQTCLACHGPDAKGLPNLGKDLTTSEFVRDNTDEELLAYVIEGRAVDDPLNTTGIAMPPKGGFDFLRDDDILKIIAFIRSVQE